MQIEAKKAVSIEYTLKNDQGQVIDKSGDQPLTYLHGVGNLVPGVEKALEGKGPGDAIQVTVSPEEGYGARRDDLVRNLPARKLGNQPLKVGQLIELTTDHGPLPVRVTAVKGDYVTIDANHPLAGMTLHFDLKVVDVRDATEEELQHGHVHGAGGHQH